jgi:regulator of cell morphogenesis and NO signaling
MNTVKELTLSEIVRKFSSAAPLFEKYDLDYCCHGKRTLQEACEGDLVKFSKVEHSLHRIFENELNNTNVVHFEKMEVADLINHIVNKHHYYVKENVPLIYAHLEKVSSKHGNHHPELLKIFELFNEVKIEMEQHMLKEEHVLFPRIKILAEALRENQLASPPVKAFIAAPVRMMEMEHEKVGEALHLIRELTNNYNPPAEACTTYRLSFNELKEFEHDLHQHVHLENNILFPKALEMEQAILN